MNWEQALELILANINEGDLLPPNTAYGRQIINTPPFRCGNYNYENSPGYKVRIGNNTFIQIPLSMLQKVFTNAIENYDGIYKNQVFGDHYSRQLNNHGCHVHVVGKIFLLSHVADKVNNRRYRIL